MECHFIPYNKWTVYPEYVSCFSKYFQIVSVVVSRVNTWFCLCLDLQNRVSVQLKHSFQIFLKTKIHRIEYRGIQVLTILSPYNSIWYLFSISCFFWSRFVHTCSNWTSAEKRKKKYTISIYHSMNIKYTCTSDHLLAQAPNKKVSLNIDYSMKPIWTQDQLFHQCTLQAVGAGFLHQCYNLLWWFGQDTFIREAPWPSC